MPRRVLSVTTDHVRKHALHTPEGRKAFMRHRMPDHEEWTAELHKHSGTGTHMLVLDHNDPDKPLAALQPYHHGGHRLVHAGGRPDVDCAEPDCEELAVHGSNHCPKHFPLPIGS